ncbi:MAG: universal stress protein [Cytophagaceae bacterium]
MKTILVPTDFSKEAENALEVAASIARRTDSKIILLHIVEGLAEDSYSVSASSIHDDGMDKVFIMKMIEKADKQMKKIIAAAELEGIEVKEVVKVGSVYKKISEIIAEHNVDLIVMGTQGVTSVSELFTGSNTEKVVRLAKCLVLSVKTKAQRFNIKNVVFATNFKDDSQSFIDRIKELQDLFGFNLNVVFVNTPMNFQSDQETNDQMAEYASEHKLRNYTLHIVNSYTEEDGIRHFAEEAEADIIALSTHGRKGLSNFFIGSVSQDLVNYAPKPILTYNVNY